MCDDQAGHRRDSSFKARGSPAATFCSSSIAMLYNIYIIFSGASHNETLRAQNLSFSPLARLLHSFAGRAWLATPHSLSVRVVKTVYLTRRLKWDRYVEVRMQYQVPHRMALSAEAVGAMSRN